MKIKSFSVKNYKCFSKQETIELKPLTILIGKNSAGKSVITRMPLLFTRGFSKHAESPLELDFDGLSYGGSLLDLIYNRNPHGAITFGIKFELANSVERELRITIQHFDEYRIQIVTKLEVIESNGEKLQLDWIGRDPINDAEDFILVGENISVKLTFMGLLPTELSMPPISLEVVKYVATETIERVNEIQRLFQDLTYSLYKIFDRITYLGPFREEPKRSYQLPSKRIRGVGASGIRTPELLADDILRKKGKLLESVSAWFAEHLGGYELDISRGGDTFSLILREANKDCEINITDVGAGIAQLLPIVVQRMRENIEEKTSVPPPFFSGLEIIEQPELHLHPRAHGEVADLFINTLNASSTSFLIETHSENFLLRVRRRIAEGVLDHEKVICHWVDQDSQGNTVLRQIRFDSLGDMDFWPEGVFSEDFEEVRKIRIAQQRNQ